VDPAAAVALGEAHDRGVEGRAHPGHRRRRHGREYRQGRTDGDRGRDRRPPAPEGAGAQRNMQWPVLKRAGCGNMQRPCGPAPTAIVLSTCPVLASTTVTVPSKRFDVQSVLPSGASWIMSGLPPTGQVAVTLRPATSTREIVPARRLVT